MISRVIAFFQTNGFVLELLLCNVIFTCFQPKRSFYWLRVLLSASVLLVSAVLLNNIALSSVFFNFLKYFIWFLLTVLSGVFTCCISFPVALFFGIGAFVCQHMAFKMGDTILFLLPASTDELLQNITYIAATFGTYLFAFFVYVRRIKTMSEKYISQNQFVLLCTGVAVYVSVLQFIFAEHSDQIHTALFLTYSSLDILCCLFALSIQYGLFKSNKLEEEKLLMEHILRMQEDKFRISKENIELINIKCHDLKKQLSSLSGLEKEDLQQLSDSLNVYDMSVKTGNEVLDIILAEKSLLCQRSHIHLECMAGGDSLRFINTADVYSLFGNAIDNAVESVLKVQDFDRRCISLSIKEAFGLVVFHIENPYEGILQFESGLPVTTKSDKDFHGFGMKSIQHVAKKYNGFLSISTQDGLFSLNITIPIPSSQSSPDS